jgi:hypothetical protein
MPMLVYIPTFSQNRCEAIYRTHAVLETGFVSMVIIGTRAATECTVFQQVQQLLDSPTDFEQMSQTTKRTRTLFHHRLCLGKQLPLDSRTLDIIAAERTAAGV